MPSDDVGSADEEDEVSVLADEDVDSGGAEEESVSPDDVEVGPAGEEEVSLSLGFSQTASSLWISQLESKYQVRVLWTKRPSESCSLARV